MKKSNLKKIVKLQRFWKELIAFKRDVAQELGLFRNILEKIMVNLETSYKNEIFSLNEYKKSIDLLQYTYNILNEYPHTITIKTLNKQSKFQILSNLARMKFLQMALPL